MAKSDIPDTPPKVDESKAVIAYCDVCGGPMYDAIYHIVVEVVPSRKSNTPKNETGAQVCSHQCAEAWRKA